MGYCTDLTDKQWQVIENFLDDKDRKRKHSLRSTAFSFKKYCSSLVIVVKSLIFAHTDAEAPP